MLSAHSTKHDLRRIKEVVGICGESESSTRISLFWSHRVYYMKREIRSDHNEDDSISITRLWLKRVEPLYHNNRVHWSNDRFAQIIAFKEEAFQFARKCNTDFVFFCDVDVLLTYPKTLDILIKLNLPLVSPMLVSANQLYSNFWALEEYYIIIQSHYVGEFNVSIVHSAVLVNLNIQETKFLAFDRN
uniref:Uncharacterized protein n=1 Tax=Megaselia scalaris TaxID=36166 RepID=T1GN45_MEGSC